MKSEHEMLEKLKKLSDMQMSPHKQQEIWDNIEEGINDIGPKRTNRHHSIWGTSAAAFAAVVILAGGIYAVTNQKGEATMLESEGSTAATINVGKVTTAVRKLLPQGATIIPQGHGNTPFLTVDMNHDGQTEYGVLYRYKPYNGGAMIFNVKDGQVKKLWQSKDANDNPEVSLSVKDLFHNKKEEVLLKARAGGTVNNYVILAQQNGKVQPIFTTSAYRLDVGDYQQIGTDDIATWLQDNGDEYIIHIYRWNSYDDQYHQVPNTTAPDYFKSTVIPHYLAFEKTTKGKTEKGLMHWALAKAYYDADEYHQALGEINTLSKSGSYPPQYEEFKQKIESAIESAIARNQ